MDYKHIILECLQNNKAAMEEEREENYLRWRAWSAEQGKAIVVFGAKEMCELCIRHLEKMEIRVDIICDNDVNCFGELITDGGRSIEIVSVEEAMSRYNEILCFVAAGAHHHQAIAEQLKQYKVEEIVRKPYLNFYLETMLYICYKKFPLVDKIRELMNFYEDEESFKIIWAHIAMLFHLENVPKELRQITMEGLCIEPQYFLENGKYLKDTGIMIDCGAFIGDTLEDFIYKTKYNNFEQYDCYEMDPASYESLNNNLEKIDSGIRGKIHTYNLGVGETNAELRFRSNISGKSSVMPNGEASAKIIKLDDAYANKIVSFIKMDIEGSEQAALKGGQNLISRCRPICAICVYHSLAAFWEIPQLLRKYVPEYVMMLRHHSMTWGDTVCYAKMGAWK